MFENIFHRKQTPVPEKAGNEPATKTKNEEVKSPEAKEVEETRDDSPELIQEKIQTIAASELADQQMNKKLEARVIVQKHDIAKNYKTRWEKNKLSPIAVTEEIVDSRDTCENPFIYKIVLFDKKRHIPLCARYFDFYWKVSHINEGALRKKLNEMINEALRKSAQQEEMETE